MQERLKALREQLEMKRKTDTKGLPFYELLEIVEVLQALAAQQELCENCEQNLATCETDDTVWLCKDCYEAVREN